MKKNMFFFFFLLVSFIFLVQSIYSQDGLNIWTLTYNNNGRVYAMVINPVNQSIIYEAGLDSGVYKTTNGGVNWVPVNNGLTYNKVQALAISPSNPNILFAGTDQLGTTNSGVYKTTDAGVTWTLMNSGITETSIGIQAIAIHPTNPNIVYVTVFDGVNAATNGMYKSTNGGANWIPSNTGMTNKNILSLVINPLNPNTIYAGSSLILPGSTGPSKIFKSYDGGGTWAEFSSGLPTGTTTGDPVRVLTMSTLDTSVVLAALFINDTAGGAYLTTNGGANWVKKYGLPNVAGTLLRAALIKPGSNVEFYIGLDGGGATSRGVWRTTDAGTTWADFNNGVMLNTYTIRALVFKTTGDPTLYAGTATASPTTGRGVFEYSWPAPLVNGWVAQTSGVTTSLNTVSAVNQNVGWIGGNGGVVLRTTNGGSTWANVTGTPIGTADVYAICGIDANTCLVSTSPNATFVYRTSNGGTNWTQVFTQTGGFIDDIKFQNATTGFMYGDPVGARWSLWKTSNGGVNWDSTGLYLAQTGTEAGWNNAMWVNGNNIWFGTNNTRVYYSTNFGSSWQFGATTGSVNTYSVAFNTGGIGFAGQTIALKSTNSGANWSTVTLPGTGTCYSFNNVLNRYWYDRGSSIYWSSDNGANFTSQFTGTGTYQAMNLDLDGNIIRGWSVTSAGGIAGYYELLTGVSNNQNEVPSNYGLSQNYPNPFNPSTKISFSLPKAGNVKLIVYDILGREVTTLVNEFTTAGNHTIDFNASSLSSGVYLYKIKAGDFVDTKKMVLIK